MQLLEYVNTKRGKRTELARALVVPRILISQWALKRRNVPAERCPEIERATDGRVTCEELRPDVDWAVLRRSAKEGSDA